MGINFTIFSLQQISQEPLLLSCLDWHFYSIIECFGLEENLKIIQFQPSCHGQGWHTTGSGCSQYRVAWKLQTISSNLLWSYILSYIARQDNYRHRHTQIVKPTLGCIWKNIGVLNLCAQHPFLQRLFCSAQEWCTIQADRLVFLTSMN